MNALYVAAEFSTVSARKSRLSRLAAEGNHRAEIILNIIDSPRQLDTYVATCQVGITISSLVLGYIGQVRLGESLVPILEKLSISTLAAQSVSVTIVLIGLSFVQVLLGELIPKNLGIQFPEQLATWTHLPMEWSSWLFKPLIWLFNGSGVFIMRLFGLEANEDHTHIHSPEEITMLAEESRASGVLDEAEHLFLKNTLKMRDSMIKHVMIPRTRMLSAPHTLSPLEMLNLLAESPYSRMPVFKDTIDNVIGVVHLRDLLCYKINGSSSTLKELVHSIPFIPETMIVRDVFTLLQKRHFQVAIILDEYGGTAGMVTLEDLLEQIFGDLQDEFDLHTPMFQLESGQRLWIRGDARISDVNEMLHLELSIKDAETIGGLILNTIGHVPTEQEKIKVGNIEFRVEEMTGRGIAFVSIAIASDQHDKLIENLTQ